MKKALWIATELLKLCILLGVTFGMMGIASYYLWGYIVSRAGGITPNSIGTLFFTIPVLTFLTVSGAGIVFSSGIVVHDLLRRVLYGPRHAPAPEYY